MAEEFVGHRECEMQHEALTDRLDKMESRSDENFGRVFEKLDSLSVFKGKVEVSDQKIEVLGRKFDKHVDGHTGFILISLAVLTVASTLVSVILIMMRNG